MKTLVSTTLALVLLGAAPALAMTCCGSGKGETAICTKGSIAMSTKGRKAGCCCEGVSADMSKRG